MTRTLIVRAEAEADLAASKLWHDEQHDAASKPIQWRLVFCASSSAARLYNGFPSACSMSPHGTVISSWWQCCMRHAIRACGGNARGLPADNRRSGP